MRGSRRTAAILLALGLIAPSAAGAANGDQLRQIEAGGGRCGINVGLAFDGTNLYVSCYDDNRIDVVTPADGTLVRTFSVTGVSSLGALTNQPPSEVVPGLSRSQYGSGPKRSRRKSTKARTFAGKCRVGSQAA